MGTVWGARDLTLERPVAIKLVHEKDIDAEFRARFLREARAAAAVNHPGVVQVFEIGEENGSPFIVMELLEGETLAARLARGALAPGEAITITLKLLEALGALHDRGLIHRDVKPSNVFLLPDGRVKILDFGLVRSFGPADREKTSPLLTMAGVIMGTPAYMSPEQIQGDPISPSTDLFSLAAVLYEMLGGRPAFTGRSIGEILASVLKEEPPPLGGSGAGIELDRVLRKSLAKRSGDRHPSAASLAGDLRAVSQGADTSSLARPIRTTKEIAIPRRLAVLPFRFLRPDPDLDFLGFSLADAIALSLSSIEALVVRSTIASAPFATAAPDIRAIAEKLDVDVILVGTFLRIGDVCRVAAQLVETPGGKLLWSQTSDSSVKDIFELQDSITKKIVEALRLPLSGREERALASDVPASPAAYECFLRANQAAIAGGDLSIARRFYLQCLDEDPDFAPAWARLGRCYRIQAKYSTEGRDENRRLAVEALARAIEVNPNLGAAHHVLAQLDVEAGRSEAAVERLLSSVRRNPNDAEGWTGLVLAFRYLGLLDESLEADRRAKRIDPEIRTSIFHTHLAKRDMEKALEVGRKSSTYTGFEECIALVELDRNEEALLRLKEEEARCADNLAKDWGRSLRGWVEGDRPLVLESVRRLRSFPDSEGFFYLSKIIARLGEEIDLAAELFEDSVHAGYANVPFFRNDPWIHSIRDHPRFQAAYARAEERHVAAKGKFGGSI